MSNLVDIFSSPHVIDIIRSISLEGIAEQVKRIEPVARLRSIVYIKPVLLNRHFIGKMGVKVEVLENNADVSCHFLGRHSGEVIL